MIDALAEHTTWDVTTAPPNTCPGPGWQPFGVGESRTGQPRVYWRRPAAAQDDKPAPLARAAECVTDDPPEPPDDAKVIVSIQHGDGPGEQAFALVIAHPPSSRVWVADTCQNQDATTQGEDARVIRQMLGRALIEPHRVNRWLGFSPAGCSKTNRGLMRHLQGFVLGAAPRICFPKVWPGSVTYSVRLLKRLADEGRLYVLPAAGAFAQDCETWRGGWDDPPILDAVRCAVKEGIDPADIDDAAERRLLRESFASPQGRPT